MAGDRSKPRAWLVHGFNVRDGGAQTVDRLEVYFAIRGYEPVDFDYGWVGLLGVRFGNSRRARQLAERVRPGDIGVGHSNGCTVLHIASHLGAPFRYLSYIAPALDRDLAPGPSVERCDVWHSHSDVPVRLSRLLLWHPWGEMGRRGYLGDDARMYNHDKERYFAVKSIGHSDVFEPDKLRFFGPLIADLAPPPEASSRE